VAVKASGLDTLPIISRFLLVDVGGTGRLPSFLPEIFPRALADPQCFWTLSSPIPVLLADLSVHFDSDRWGDLPGVHVF